MYKIFLSCLLKNPVYAIIYIYVSLFVMQYIISQIVYCWLNDLLLFLWVEVEHG